MTFKLVNKKSRADGIFGVLLDGAGKQIAVTLTHSYPQPDGTYSGKTPPGTYKCVRGMHRLHGMTHDFETFEITNVPGHSGVLFHVGNFNRDSEGCFLLGEKIVTAAITKTQMITDSKKTFTAFMDGLVGVDEFDLVIS